MNEVEVILSLCTLWNGVPHGLAIIQYNNPKSELLSFKGVGIFDNGKLHNSPFSCIDSCGWGYTFNKMHNGRPLDGSFHTQFYRNGEKQQVGSLEKKTDVSGWQSYSGQVNKERGWNGNGKKWKDDGSIYLGDWQYDKKK